MHTEQIAPLQKLVSFTVDARWQPVAVASNNEGRVGQFIAEESRYVVVTYIERAPELGETRHHGAWWDREDAVRYARSCTSTARVEEVPAYWYCVAWGRVD